MKKAKEGIKRRCAKRRRRRLYHRRVYLFLHAVAGRRFGNGRTFACAGAYGALQARAQNGAPYRHLARDHLLLAGLHDNSVHLCAPSRDQHQHALCCPRARTQTIHPISDPSSILKQDNAFTAHLFAHCCCCAARENTTARTLPRIFARVCARARKNARTCHATRLACAHAFLRCVCAFCFCGGRGW